MKTLKFSDNLRKALSSLGITQQELANRLETTQATVSRWLKGVNEPDLSTLIEICLILDETPNYLLGFDEIPQEIITSYRASSNK